jgi:hypothetical protein
MSTSDNRVWDYSTESFVHRLITNQPADGMCAYIYVCVCVCVCVVWCF